MNFPQKVWIKHICDGNGYLSNDFKYIAPFHNMVCDIVMQFPNKTYLTNLFNPAFKDQVNDYIYHGFLVVTDGNIQLLNPSLNGVKEDINAPRV